MTTITPPTRHVFTKLIPVMKPGQSIIVDSSAKTCTSYAAQLGLKIRTAKVLVIEDIQDNPTVTTQTRVTVQ